MTEVQKTLRRWCAALSLVTLACGGCHCGDHGPAINHCADIPPGAIPNPSGTFTCRWQTAHAQRAEQDHFVIYQYDWKEGGPELGPCGQRHLEELAVRLPHMPLPIIIEPTGDRALDENRRIRVLDYLASRGVEIKPVRVIVAWPEAEGLYGLEAPRVAAGMLSSSGGGSGASATNVIGSGTTGTSGIGGGFGGQSSFRGF